MKRYVGLFKQTVSEFSRDNAPRLGAALAYYTIFSIGPLLLIAVAVAGLVFGQEAARGRLSDQLTGVFGSQMAEALETIVEAAAKPKSGMLATVIGLVTLLFGASGVVGQLKEALNTIWNVKSTAAGGFKGFLKDRIFSMAMVLAVGFLLLVTLVLDTMISATGDYLAQKIFGGEAMLHTIQLLLSFAMVTLLFALIFRYLPDIRVPWHDVWLGAGFTSALFVIGKFALGLYLGKAAVGSSYGAAGSLVILLLWVYYSAQILFFGAEFTQVYARTRGTMKGDTSKETAPVTPTAHVHGPSPAPIVVRQRSGKGSLALGGLAGLLAGAILGGLAAAIVVVKSVKKLLMLPFR